MTKEEILIAFKNHESEFERVNRFPFILHIPIARGENALLLKLYSVSEIDRLKKNANT